MAYDLPHPRSLQVGEAAEATTFDNCRYVSATLTPTTVSASAAFFAATVTGIHATLDECIMVDAPAQSALTAFPVFARVSGTNTITIFYGGALSTGTVPNAGAYKFMVWRSSQN